MSEEEQHIDTNGKGEIEIGTLSAGNPEDENDGDEKVAFLPPSTEPESTLCGNLHLSAITRRRSTVESDSTPVTNNKALKYPKRELSVRYLLAFLLVSIAGLFLIVGHYSSRHQTSYKHVADPYAALEWGDLKLKDIRNWCLTKSNCTCANPLYPKNRKGYKTWWEAYLYNKKQAASYSSNELDVVFLGDSITEGWNGMSFGVPVERKKEVVPIFEKLFRKEHGAKFEGLALGIAGDKTNNLLWRIQNGEIPDTLNPKIWWVLIGTNDFVYERVGDKKNQKFCSEEVVTMGIVRVLEELRRIRPDAKIVVNALLPRADYNRDNKHDGKLYKAKELSKRKNIWTAIEAVNEHLNQFCREHDGFYYVNFQQLFISEHKKAIGWDRFYIPSYLMEDFLHPTPLGYQIWGEEIVKELTDLIDT